MKKFIEVKCSVCGWTDDASEMETTDDGFQLCSHCFMKLGYFCQNCGKVYYHSEAVQDCCVYTLIDIEV